MTTTSFGFVGNAMINCIACMMNQLYEIYNTKEKILSSLDMQKFIAWRKKHPEFAGHSKMRNKRKHK